MVYIIGIDHLLQYNGPVPEYLLEEFRNFLSARIIEFNISVIAEEFNEEFLFEVLGATEATAKIVAGKSGVDHIFCDPEEHERKVLGIPYYADVRECVKLKYGIKENFIFDNALRKKVHEETAAEVKKYWAVRERFWFDRIKERLAENILFLCGHEHVTSFRDYLEENGIEVCIVDEFWRREIFSDYGKLGLR